MYYIAVKILAWISFNFFFSLKYEGKENLPKKGEGFVLVSNHRSYCDPIFIGMGVKQRVVFMAKKELFERKVMGWFCRNMGAFAVDRGAGDGKAIENAVNVVKTGGALALFPEGTRSKDGKPLRPRSGAAIIANQTGARVIPTCVQYEGKLGKFRRRVVVRYGNPIENESLGINIDSPKPGEIRNATRLVFDEVIKLLDKGV